MIFPKKLGLKTQFIFLAITLLGIVVAMNCGAVRFRSDEILLAFKSLLTGSEGLAEGGAGYTILITTRLPRVLLALLVGAALSIAGVTMQSLVRNELADPYIMGVTSGAATFATFGMVIGSFAFLGIFQNALNGSIGALVAILLVYLYSRENGRINVQYLLFGGIGLAYFTKSMLAFIALKYPQIFMHQDDGFWTQGGLAGARWVYLTWPLLMTLISFVVIIGHFRTLNALSMGEETAVSIGINVPSMQKFTILLTSVMVGIAVAMAGGIGFVGLIGPHVTRLLVGSDHKRVFQVAPWIGGLFVLFADTVARSLFAPQELSVGIVTALVGGPFFIYLLKSKGYRLG